MKIKGYQIEQILADREDIAIAKAIQSSLHRPVFLKILKELKSTPDVIERFKNEAQLLAKLNHPNIVTVFDLDISDTQAIIALEYFDGEDLKSYVERESQLTSEQLIEFSFQILTGCAQAHETGVIHGDIKPGNILINKNGLVKLSDFGLATITGQVKGPVSGTPGFMAPELALGESPSINTDIFAIGMTLYVLATGENPLLGADLSESLNLSIQHNPRSLSDLRDDLPDSFVKLVHRMIAKTPHERLKSCESALELLREEHRPSEVAPLNIHLTTQPDHESSPMRSKSVRARYSIVLLLVVLAMISSFFFDWPWFIQTQGEADASPSEGTNPGYTLDSLGPEVDQVSIRLKETDQSDNHSPKEVNPVEAIEAIIEVSDDSSPQAPVDTVGGLYLAASPWAEIHVDGKMIGVTPIIKPVLLDSGEHTVQFLHPDYPDLLKTANIRPGKVDSLTLNWSKSLGFVNVTVHPWAEVFINSRSYDMTPLVRPIPLQPGEFQLFLKNPEFPPWNQYLTVAAGDTLNVNVRLQKSKAG